MLPYIEESEPVRDGILPDEQSDAVRRLLLQVAVLDIQHLVKETPDVESESDPVFGSDFIPERLTMSVVEMVEPEAMECVLDYDADAASRKARQESPDIRAWATDMIPALLPVADGRAPMLFRLPAWRDASLACIPFYDTPLFVRVCSYLI